MIGKKPPYKQPDGPASRNRYYDKTLSAISPSLCVAPQETWSENALPRALPLPACSFCQTESSTELLCFTQDSERGAETLRTFHTNARSCNGRFYYHCYDEKLQKFGATRWQHAVFDLFLAVQAKIQHKITNGVGQTLWMASLLVAQCPLVHSLRGHILLIILYNCTAAIMTQRWHCWNGKGRGGN